MKPLKQRNLHRPDEGVWGDCHRAAVASILELPLDEVSHFGDGGPDGEQFNQRVQDWLRYRGLFQIQVAFEPPLINILACMKKLNPGLYYMLSGKSRTGVNHTVVAYEDQIVHDPSLTDSGIVGPCTDDGLYWIVFLGRVV